jgi:hypothetical protein
MPKVTLFEIRMQRLASESWQAHRRAGCHVAWHLGLRGPILQASSEHFRPSRLLAALVLEIDTKPKPDGLGLRNTKPQYESLSNNLE